jgi:hypothetical protein
MEIIRNAKYPTQVLEIKRNKGFGVIGYIIANEGNPFAKCTSTVTSGASMPLNARLLSTARLIAS